MKKVFLALVLAVLSLTATLPAGEIELRFAWWGGAARHEATLAAIQLFESRNPGVKIKAEYMGWNGYIERLTTQMGSSAEADIIQMDWAWLATFSKNGDGFYDLLQAKDKIDLGAYEQKWIDTCMVKGKLNALPVSFTTRFFLWNKTVWDKAGVNIPQTWDELVAAGPKFKEKLGDDYYPLDVNLNSVAHMMASYIFQKTGRMLIDPQTDELGVSVEELEEMLGYYRRLVDNHALTSLQVRTSRSGDPDSQTHEQPDYIEGRWAGNYQWDSTLVLALSTPKDEFKFVVGPWPDMPDAKNSGRIGRPAQVIAVSKNSKHPEMAAAFVSFLLTTADSARILQTTRGPLLAKPAFEELQKNNLISPYNLAASEQLEGVQVYTPSPYFEDPRMLKTIDDLIENIGYNKMTVREGAELLAREIPKLMRRLTR